MKRIRTLSLLAIAAIFVFSFKSASDSYTLDVGHTYIGFDVERFMVGEVSGRFNEFSGDLTMEGDDLSTLQVDVTIQVNSLDSNNETRDGHLKSGIWLNAPEHPEIKFSSTGISGSEGNYRMTGDLTIRGVTKSLEFPVELSGPFQDPTRQQTVGIKADLEIDRFDYGISFSKTMDNGVLFIGKTVKIKIRALAQKK